jgi:secretion/DNA translocation related TadE-like protein
VTLAGLLVIAVLLAGGLARLLVDQRRASTAADLAALAGAGALQVGEDGCQAARLTARDNEAELVACVVTGDHIRLRTSVSSLGIPGLFGALRRSVAVEAEAYAGPVD